MENRDVASDVMTLENQLRGLMNAERAPIIGPCLESIRCRAPKLLAHGIFDAIRRNLRGKPHSVKMLENILSQFPAITALLIAIQVNESYNSQNEYAVQRVIEGLLGSSPALSESERKRVWKAFRTACYRIGLKISSRESGQGYMVEEYLHQAGLPLTFVERVTEQMIRTASEVGVPDEDDSEGLARWQERLLWHSRYLTPTALRALEADETFFYSRMFLKASSEGVTNASDKTAAGIMGRVLTDGFAAGGRTGWRRALRIPRLLWRNDELVVEIPPGDDREWKIAAAGSECTYRGEDTATTVSLMTGLSLVELPREVTIESGDFRRTFPLWEDNADNCFQIFHADGQWLKAAVLGSGRVSLLPGKYSLLLRFEPQAVQEECCPVSYDPYLCLLPITLQPGQEFSLRRGPAEVLLKAEQRSWLRFQGERLNAASGEEIYYGSELSLDLLLGEAQVCSSQNSEGDQVPARLYDVRVEAGGTELLIRP